MFSLPLKFDADCLFDTYFVVVKKLLGCYGVSLGPWLLLQRSFGIC